MNLKINYKNDRQNRRLKFRSYHSLILFILLSFPFQNFQVLSQFAQTRETVTRMEKILASIAVYEYDKSRGWLPDFQIVMQEVYKDLSAMKETEKMMLQFLQSDATFTGKQFICKHLSTIATSESVPVMKKMLMDPNTAEMALHVLEKIPDPAASRIMIHSIQKSDPKIKVAIINSLGVRRYDKAVKVLAKHVYDKDPMISESALHALGAIGSDESAELLNVASKILASDLKWKAMDAWLKCADRFAGENKKIEARKIYEKVSGTNPPLFIQKAALRGMFLTTTEDPVDFIIEHLKSDAPEILPALISLIYELPAQSNPVRIYYEETGLSEINQLYLFTAIASHGDPSFNKIIKEAIHSENDEMRMAGLKAIAKSGHSSDILFIAEKASMLRGTERDLARESLYTMSDPDANKSILSAIEEADPKIKVELIRSIGERNISSAVDLLLDLSAYPDPAVRAESIEALGKIAMPDDLPGMIQVLVNSSSERERKMTETAIYLVTQKMPDDARKSKDILMILPAVKDPVILNSCISIIGDIGDNQDYPVLKEYLYSDHPDVQLSTIRALSNWPDATPKQDLKTIVETTEDISKHTLALRGYIQVVIVDEILSEDQKFNEIHHAFNIASSADEQKIVLSGLGKITSPESLKFAISLLNNPNLIREAEAAVMSIADNLSWSYPDETRIELNKVLQFTDNEEFKKEIEDLLKNIRK